MKSHDAGKVIAGLFGIALGVSVLIGFTSCRREQVVVVSAAGFANATNIVFTERYGSDSNEWKHLTVSDPNALRRFVSFAQLRTKQYCACGHSHEALFQSSSGALQVSFCNHCFNVENGQSPGGYAMPEEFYNEFYGLVRQMTNGGWHVDPPYTR